MACHFCFFTYEFEFQDSVCNTCHYLLMLCLNISDIAIITVKRVYYSCIIHDIGESEANHLSENSAVYIKCTWTKSVLKMDCTTIILTV